MPMSYTRRGKPSGEKPSPGWDKAATPRSSTAPARVVYRKPGRGPQGLQVIEVTKGQLYLSYPGGRYHNTLRAAQDSAETVDAEVHRDPRV